MRDLRWLYLLLSVALLAGAASLIGLGVWIDQIQMRRERIAWDAERAAAAAERATLYGRLDAVRLSGIEQSAREVRDLHAYYRQIGRARDMQYGQLIELYTDTKKHDAEQDRRIGLLLEQNGQLLRQSAHRVAVGDAIAQQTAVAVARASEAASAAQQAVRAVKGKSP